MTQTDFELMQEYNELYGWDFSHKELMDARFLLLFSHDEDVSLNDINLSEGDNVLGISDSYFLRRGEKYVNPYDSDTYFEVKDLDVESERALLILRKVQ